MLKIALCDDDIFIMHNLRQMLKEYFKKKYIEISISEFTSGELLLKKEESYDIAFLDIEMGVINGIQVGYELQKLNSQICLFIVTAFHQYLDDAMDLKVFRYLDKPVNKERLFRALDIATATQKDIRFNSDHNEVDLNESQIVCIYTSLRKTHVLTDSGNIIPTNMKMKQWNDLLNDSSSFSSPHYSYLVNLKYVTRFDDNIITLECKNGKKMQVYASQRKLSQFKKDFYSKMREQR